MNSVTTSYTAAELIAFEQRVVAEFKAGELPYLIHLSGGNEDALLRLFNGCEGQFERDLPTPKAGDWFLSGHRSHYHYLLAANLTTKSGKFLSEDHLLEEIRRGRSMFVFDKSANFLTSSVLAGLCGVAAGIALQYKLSFVGIESQRPNVWCFLGDGAEDEGHFYEALMFVEGNDLPCYFIVEDNDRSVDTTKAQRRGSMGGSYHTQPSDRSHVYRYHYTPTFPHGGAGLKEMVTFKPEAIARHLENEASR